MAVKNVIIIGAAGRDFHNFNTCFRDNPDYRVVAFTAAQIPDIAGKIPAELSAAYTRIFNICRNKRKSLSGPRLMNVSSL
jgi:predicted GTPase